MHKLLLITICMLCSLTAKSQFQKGSTLLEAGLGLNFDFKNDNSPDDAKTEYSVFAGISAGRFINAKNEVGIGLSYSTSQGNVFTFLNQSLIISQSNTNTYTGRLFFRHYSNLTDKLLFSSGFSGSYSYYDVTTENIIGDEINTGSSNISIGYTPSLVYLLSNRIGLRGSFGFAGCSFNKQESDVWQTNLSLNFSPNNLNFGIFLLLNGAKSDD